MTERYYPALGPLIGVLRLIAEDVQYLDDEACPYTEDEKKLLRGAQRPVTAAPTMPKDLTQLDVATEAQRLYFEIREWGRTLDKSDTTEMATVFRNSTTLLERLLNISSKANDLKELVQWKSRLLSFMEDVLDENQRITFEQRLAMEVEKSK